MRNQITQWIATLAVVLLMIAGFVLPLRALADSAEPPTGNQAYQIAARSDRSDRGFGDSVVDLKMVLRNAAGQETSRELQIATYELPDENVGDKSLVVFKTPRDIEGTALLSYAKILEPDDQWLYLPALKRVKRVSSANKSGPFVGSEFAFEDFTSLELNKFSYEFIGEETWNGMPVDVVERTPRYENSGYTRQVARIDQQIHQIRQVDFYDRRGDLLKTLTLDDYREYGPENGTRSIWRAQRLHMVNHQTGKSTDLVYGDYAFNTGQSEDDFVKGRLTRLQ